MAVIKYLTREGIYHIPDAKNTPLCGAAYDTITYPSEDQAALYRAQGAICPRCENEEVKRQMRAGGHPELF